MRKLLLFISLFVVLTQLIAVKNTAFAQGQQQATYGLTCGCPAELGPIYAKDGESCVTDIDTFNKSPSTNHYWVEDPDITSQGKADERARQFIYWVIHTDSIDNHPTILKIWNTTRNLAYFFVIVMAAVMGIGIIVSQRTNFVSKIQVWPQVWKILMALVYITFSAAIVLTVIQLSEVLMKFFIENLGGKDLFNIDFGVVSNESSYLKFIRGCHDLNYRVQEGVHAEVFLLKMTNVTYYVMGVMLLLRKILLWFLLFVSPFLALLMPFVFIRNIGWIWIGVFFQWVFYGPLFALFLGALSTIWKNGIPFVFDFSRVNSAAGYIYPTSINILYGGPAQQLSVLNNGNYVDTFAEYIITLLMLWAVTFFPWWLLRIFRDYCCDGIIASKNILLSMYDQMRNGNPPQPPQPPAGPTALGGTALKLPQAVTIPVQVRIETIEQIKKAKTEDITKSLHLSATKLTDIAHYETNKTTRETMNRNLNYLKNPIAAETPTERQKYMNIRTELFSRAVKQDTTAKHVLTSITTSQSEQRSRREELLRTISTPSVPITHIVSVKVKMPQEKTRAVTSSFIRSANTNNTIISTVSQNSNVSSQQVQSTLQSLTQHVDGPTTQIATTIANETHIPKEQVTTILKSFAKTVKLDKEITKQVATEQSLDEKVVKDVVETTIPAIAEPEKHIEQTVGVPPSVSLEDYEEVKKMWKEQYEKGEVPVSDNITSREKWVDTDIVFITNTLNKLLSVDEPLRQQGLDDVGYILPIFLINNLNGEELVTYLKAKLEAAKSVKEEKEKETEMKKKMKNEEKEELVDVEKPKQAEAEKTMEMKAELKEELPAEKTDDPKTNSPPRTPEKKEEPPSGQNT